MSSNPVAAGHTVFCVKFQKEMPGLDEPPFDTELGQKVYDNVSQEAWRMWNRALQDGVERVPPESANPKDQEVIVKHLENFFWGENAALPPGYVPQQGGGGHHH